MNKQLTLNGRVIPVGVKSKGYLIDFITGEKVRDTPEERVRQAVEKELAEVYGYKKERIRPRQPVQIGSERREADIVVFQDDTLRSPFIVVETKSKEKRSGLKQGESYASALGARYVLWTNGVDKAVYDREIRDEVSDIPPAYKVTIPLRYGKGIGEPLKPIPDVSTFRKILDRCHDVLRNIEHKTLDRAFDIMSRILYAKLWDEIHTHNDYYSFQAGYAQTIHQVAERIITLYRVARRQEPKVFPEDIGVSEPKTLFEITRILEPWSLTSTDLEVKGEAYQHFLDVNFRGKLGQYFTHRNIVRTMVEMVDPNEHYKILDPACGSGGFLVYSIHHIRKKLREYYDPQDPHFLRLIYDFAHYNLYGIEVEERIAQTAISNMLINEDAHAHIIVEDALQSFSRIGLEPESFDVILTNPPLGLVESRREILGQYRLGKGRESQLGHVLFLERGIEFLKEGGILCTIISEDVLERGKEVVEYLERHGMIWGVISLPRWAFNPYGSNAKTNILFFQKSGKKMRDHPIFMAEVLNVGYSVSGKVSEENDFPTVLDKWKDFWSKVKRGEAVDERILSYNPLMFIVNRSRLGQRLDVKNSYLLFFAPFVKKNWQSKGYVIKRLSEVIHPSGETFKTSPETKYKFISVHFDGQATIKGELKTQYQELVKVTEGDIVMSRIDILNGAVAIIPPELDGCFVSKEFYVLRPNESILRKEYLWLVLRSPYFLSMVKGLSTGVTGRHRVKWSDIINIEIPIPKLEVQDEIVRKVRMAREYYNKARAEYDGAMKAVLNILEVS